MVTFRPKLSAGPLQLSHVGSFVLAQGALAIACAVDKDPQNPTLAVFNPAGQCFGYDPDYTGEVVHIAGSPVIDIDLASISRGRESPSHQLGRSLFVGAEDCFAILQFGTGSIRLLSLGTGMIHTRSAILSMFEAKRWRAGVLISGDTVHWLIDWPKSGTALA